MTLIAASCGNELAGYQQFKAFAGRLDMGYFFMDQRPGMLVDSWKWQVDRSVEIATAMGIVPVFSIPFPGNAWEQAGAVNRGDWDDLYTAMGRYIRDKMKGRPWWVRGPWEFNLKRDFQNQSAVGALPDFARALRRMFGLFKLFGAKTIWCPNATRYEFDPLEAWPGIEWVDLVAQDIYFDASWAPKGVFGWFRDDPRGLDWLVRFAREKGKQVAFSEWGISDDAIADEGAQFVDWMKAQGAIIHHHAYYDRDEGPIQTKLSTGRRPASAAAFRRAL
ncbi:hypothetical protein KZ820_14465 [Sphingomonas sp. RRHST34]|uniref:GH26 domain-containing protein n=1 Tax=Sphingomonas citri TaxID=2862499 RepID=A0ABS7BR45_9SPHN|nr:hypothetical protein [Sphingomonas citri]MBW6531942.1 hypothetical protein [Sphingomonas citri]